MPSLNHTAFPAKVEAGEKRCSIRAKRKRPIQAGDTIFHYTGMRTRKCRLLRRSICTKVTPIIIDGSRVFLRDEDLAAEQITDLALADGFATAMDFLDYFNRQSPRFEGDLIEWK